MICMLVNTFRDKPNQDQFDNWPKIIHFITSNINKFTHELFSLRHKIFGLGTSDNKPRVISEMRKIKTEFFQDLKFFR